MSVTERKPRPGLRLRGLRDKARPHRPFLILLALAAALRAMVCIAYRPAFTFPDSNDYLGHAVQFIQGDWTPDDVRTSGYSLVLIPVAWSHQLWLAPLVQHLAGLAAGVTVYLLLRRFGVRRWLATVATVPVLFDPLQLNLEHYVLSDAPTEFVILAALVVLLVAPGRRGWTGCTVAGALLAAASLLRQTSLVLIVPAAVYVLIAVRPGRRTAAALAGVLIGFAVPLVGYAGWYQHERGEFALSGESAHFLYGRIVQIADCRDMSVPRYERALCPPTPIAQHTEDYYMWSRHSPQWRYHAPPGRDPDAVLKDFGMRVILQRPLAYAGIVAADYFYGFSPVRGTGPEHYPTWYHEFQSDFPDFHTGARLIPMYGHTHGQAQPQLAAFMHLYGYLHVPGPLLGAGLLTCLIAAAGAGAARRSGLRGPCFLFGVGTALLLVPPAAMGTFDWRYQLPQLALVPVAAALGAAALFPRLRADAPGTGHAEPGASGGTEGTPATAIAGPARRR